MSIAHHVGVALRSAMTSLVPESGAPLTPELTRDIKRKTLALLKQRGYVLPACQVRLEFSESGQPNLIIPPHLLH